MQVLRSVLLAGFVSSATLAAGSTYEVDNTVEKADGCEQPDQGVVCVKYANMDYAHKVCRIKASMHYSDSVTGQTKKVVGHNFTHLPAYAEAKVCFDFSEQLAVFNPWDEGHTDFVWVAGKYEGSVACKQLEGTASDTAEGQDTDPE